MYMIPNELQPQKWTETKCAKAKQKRQAWLTNISSSDDIPTPAYVCQSHFVSGNANC